jgi:Cu+-exporting ATPase
LTEGKPALTGVEAARGFEQDEVLQLAASLEAGSEHPLAAAILRGAEARGLDPAKVGDFEAVTGQGVKGRVNGRLAALGNARLMQSFGIDMTPLTKAAEARRKQGETVMFLGVDEALAGLVAVADPIKSTARESIAKLHALGLEIIMATGDNETTAKAVAGQLGIDQIRAGMKPEDKLTLIDEFQRKGRVVAMAGDGVNDAPALAKADVGIAMGTGADVAMESAGLTLLKGDLRGVVRGVKLARATMRNIKQNLFFAFVYNALGVPIAAGVLYPFFGILLSPIIAAAAMSLSSVSVIGNALRLRNIDLD